MNSVSSHHATLPLLFFPLISPAFVFRVNSCAFISSNQHEKFQNVDFGRCPRVYCQGQAVLPVSLSDIPRSYSVNVYCPKCQDLFYPRSTKQANLDGAYFGTTFAHLFLLLHPDTIPLEPQQSYVPRIYGFRINASSAYYKQRW